MPELIADIDPGLVRERLAAVREEAGESVRVLVATKYVPDDDLPGLAQAGVDLVGENRLDDLERKHARFGELFEWHFIGGLQSRKVKGILPLVTLIHSVASESALEQINARAPEGTRILIQVNVAGEEAKEGIEPDSLGAFIARSKVEVAGLATMPPFAEDPESSRPYFARLAELAADHDLGELSMGTSQDWRVAVEEGATIIRLGSALLRP
ncbi:MAG: YggS family pyridoxal phosphate enzyme [Actinomycetota bacterium]|nr:YggS family pyridoxal phosphate enzyme [Actinomycetota bacterium]